MGILSRFEVKDSKISARRLRFGKKFDNLLSYREQEDHKHSRQSLEEQAKENTSRLEISKDSLESISHMMGSSGSSGLFANRKRKQDESSSEAPERNKLPRLEH